MAPRILVIAYGNPLRSDDGVAWHAAQCLRERLPSLRILSVHQLTPELAELAAEADGVLFLDAAHSGEPGEVACSQVIPEEEVSQFSHWLTPAQVMSLCAQLYGAAPRAILGSVAGACFEHGDALSEPLRNALPGLVDKVEEWIHQLANGLPSHSPADR
jgi:hydrogenase maturation protease